MIELTDQKFCNNCGFDLSKVSKSKPTELKKMIDFALKGHSSKTPESIEPKPTPKEKPNQVNQSQSRMQDEAEKQQQPSDSSTSPSAHKWRSLNSQLGEQKWWKWGIGWAILGYMFFSPQASKGYESLGTVGLALQLFGALTALALYFSFRQRILLHTIQTVWIRSLISGLISFAIVWVILFLIGKFVITSPSNLSSQTQDHESRITTIQLGLPIDVGESRQSVRAKLGNQDITETDFDSWFSYGIITDYNQLNRVKAIHATRLIKGTKYTGKVFGVQIGDILDKCRSLWGREYLKQDTPFDYARFHWHYGNYYIRCEVWTQSGIWTDFNNEAYSTNTVKDIVVSDRSLESD
ncbi:MAG: hypothetical protein HY707_07925 [Ignavibacteriae bacterium]|nr:hypothetical protein [Ignavibacteriota bacterium]